MLDNNDLIAKITDELYKKLVAENKVDNKGIESSNVASMIDHTLLKQDATEQEIIKLCREADENKFASVCINPSYVPLCSRELRNSSAKVCTVIGFPLGATTTKTKVFEAVEAVENGAHEVDMVINVGMVKSGSWDYVRNDIEAVVIAVGNRALVKVIIETCLLTDQEKEKVCQISKDVGADFVKTSTGFSTSGATAEDIALMRRVVGPGLGVKASGGIRDAQTANLMISSGANRLGTSSGIAISRGETGKSSY